MREKYIGYCKKNPEEIKKIWDEGLITFDANVLLNLYRYSTNTKKEILKLIEKFSNKIFLTHQAGLEFHRNRFETISEQEKIYKEFTENLIKIEDELNSKSKHPFLSIKLQQKLNSVFKEVKEETKHNENYYCNLIVNDEIYDEISKIFNGKTEDEFSEQELIKLLEEGKKRFESKIPPGYEDEKDKTGNKIYGDFILWKQIINKAKNSNKSIILVTDEKKKDWWWKLKNGKTIGPRQELVEEIYRETGVGFHLYSTEKFLEYGLSYLNEGNKPKVIEEVKSFTAEKSRLKELLEIIEKNYSAKNESVYNEKLMEIENQMSKHKAEQKFLSNNELEDDISKMRYMELDYLMHKLEFERLELLDKMRAKQ